jgi:anti-sigma B factor antagonist
MGLRAKAKTRPRSRNWLWHQILSLVKNILMDPPEIKMNVKHMDGVTVISPEARLDSLDGPKLKDVIKGLAQEPGLKVVIDMGNTTFLDSSGCGGLVSSLKSLLDNNGDMSIARPTPKCQKILRLTRLHRLFEIHDSLESAINSFHRPK